MVLFHLIHNQTYGESCYSKHVVYSIDDPASDSTIAHHSVASCASLYLYENDEEIDPSEPPRLCCYAKIKYKIAGKKFTRKGCYDVDSNVHIDEEIDTLKTSLGAALARYYDGQDVEIKDIKADIDCNSKFLKYSLLLILIALL